MRRPYFYASAAALGLICVLGAKAQAAAPAGALMVANSDDAKTRQAEGYVTVFDADGKETARIPDGGVMAHELVITNDGKYAYAPIYGTGAVGGEGTNGSTISIIDVASRKVVDHIDLGHEARPHYGVTGDRSGLLYITTELDEAVIIVDPATRKVIGKLPTGQPQSHNVAVSHDERRAYTSNVYKGTVSIIDVPGRKLIKVLQVTPGEKPVSGTRANWGVQRIAVSNDDRTIYTCDWISNELVAIDAKTNMVRHRTALPSACYGLAVTQDGRWLMASSYAAAKVAVLDTKTLTLAKTIDVPRQPQAILIRPDGKMAYVSNAGDKNVAAIRIADWTVDKIIPTGNWPDGLGWGGEPQFTLIGSRR